MNAVEFLEQHAKELEEDIQAITKLGSGTMSARIIASWEVELQVTQALLKKAKIQSVAKVSTSESDVVQEQRLQEMTNRFLSWGLPASFWPDGGISFEVPRSGWPTGTNLFTASQTREMLKHVVEPQPSPSPATRMPNCDWPLGINPDMDQHAVAHGLSHWSCTSLNSNTGWRRKDGRRCEPFSYLYDKGQSYVDVLKDVDRVYPMGPGTPKSDDDQEACVFVNKESNMQTALQPEVQMDEVWWPECFLTGTVLDSQPNAELCAAALTAWSNCTLSNPIPANFGKALVEISLRLGISPLAQEVSKYADELLKVKKFSGWECLAFKVPAPGVYLVGSAGTEDDGPCHMFRLKWDGKVLTTMDGRVMPTNTKHHTMFYQPVTGEDAMLSLP